MSKSKTNSTKSLRKPNRNSTPRNCGQIMQRLLLVLGTVLTVRMTLLRRWLKVIACASVCRSAAQKLVFKILQSFPSIKSSRPSWALISSWNLRCSCSSRTRMQVVPSTTTTRVNLHSHLRSLWLASSLSSCSRSTGISSIWRFSPYWDSYALWILSVTTWLSALQFHFWSSKRHSSSVKKSQLRQISLH